jgi:hypothetical protein
MLKQVQHDIGSNKGCMTRVKSITQGRRRQKKKRINKDDTREINKKTTEILIQYKVL